MTRQIQDLRWARRLPAKWPEGIPKPRPRGIKAFGKRYEASVGKFLPQAERGIWWEFRDANGPGLCQTDFVLPWGPILAILECKHTWVAEGMAQLTELYLPVVSMAVERPAIGIQVCKNLVPWAGPTFASLDEALRAALRQGTPTTLHWHIFATLHYPGPRGPQPEDYPHAQSL